MSEEEIIFSSKIKNTGIFSFKDFYQFCYDWLSEEPALNIIENKYSEKLIGTDKNMDIKWTCTKKVTDYFKYKVVVKFKIVGLSNIEIIQDGAKFKTNKGGVEVNVKSSLVRDYLGRFEATAYKKFLRGIYEKWIIPSRIEQFESELINLSDLFLGQAKAYLDLEGKSRHEILAS